MTAILGISAFYHDSAAALVVDGVIVAAAQEERFTRIKHDHQFPKQAVDYCLAVAGLTPEQVDHVVFYEKPLLKFERLLETYLAVAPAGFRSFLQAMPLWVHEKLQLPAVMNRGLGGRYARPYVFTDPLKLLKGTRVSVEFTFDNPTPPPPSSVFNAATMEEMAYLELQIAPERGDDLPAVHQAILTKQRQSRHLLFVLLLAP